MAKEQFSMSLPTDSDAKRVDLLREEPSRPIQDSPTDHVACARCQELEARIAELETAATVGRLAELAATAPAPQSTTSPSENSPVASEGSAVMTLPLVEFKALRLVPFGWGEGWQLRPSPPRRHWMDELPHAYKCLPLLLANQWGWQILCPTDVVVTWDGSPTPAGVLVEVAPQFQPAIKSQFGAGIVTFSPPWLFRTPPGWDLYLKGPSNRWKINCFPLEGIIETWWLNYTFTLNWKLVEPGTIRFSRGESLGQLSPIPHATFENATALEAPIGLFEPNAAQELLKWLETRRAIAGQKDNVHHLYRKAEGIEEHFQRVNVPPIRSIIP
jgi:Family of unknown function (DUF6065)